MGNKNSNKSKSSCESVKSSNASITNISSNSLKDISYYSNQNYSGNNIYNKPYNNGCNNNNNSNNLFDNENTDSLNIVYIQEFKKFKEPNENYISTDGFITLGNELGIDLLNSNTKDLFILFFCFRSECKKYGQISLDEFKKAISSFNVKTIKELKSKINEINKEIIYNFESQEFKNFYKFLFTFNEKKKKNMIDLDNVKLYFEILFYNKFPICKDFVYFLEKQNVTGLKLDEWNNVLIFFLTDVDNFPGDYEINSAWATILDKFYYYYCEKKGIIIEKPEFV